MSFWKECKKYFTRKEKRYPKLWDKCKNEYNMLENIVDETVVEKLGELKQEGKVIDLEDFYKKELKKDEDSYFVIKNRIYDKFISKFSKEKYEK